jgi:hypothetical protein
MADLRSILVDSVWTESLRVPNTGRVSRTNFGNAIMLLQCRPLTLNLIASQPFRSR